jgi:hypothetical protein
MAKKKLVLSFNTKERKLWCKETKERDSVECVLVAELPEEKKLLYASSIGSEELDRRYGENSLGKIADLAIKKEEGKKQLQITWEDGEEILFNEQEFALLFVMDGKTSGQEIRDSLLIVNFPKRLGQGIFQKYFPEDQEEDAGLKLFWLLKDMV